MIVKSIINQIQGVFFLLLKLFDQFFFLYSFSYITVLFSLFNISHNIFLTLDSKFLKTYNPSSPILLAQRTGVSWLRILFESATGLPAFYGKASPNSWDTTCFGRIYASAAVTDLSGMRGRNVIIDEHDELQWLMRHVN